jgi:hypothetical protein
MAVAIPGRGLRRTLGRRAPRAHAGGPPEGPRPAAPGNPAAQGVPTDCLDVPGTQLCAASSKPIMTERGLRGADGLAHWADAYGAQVCPTPQRASRGQRRQWRAARQVVDAILAHLTVRVGLTYPGAHTGWG